MENVTSQLAMFCYQKNQTVQDSKATPKNW